MPLFHLIRPSTKQLSGKTGVVLLERKQMNILTTKMPWESTIICALVVVIEMLPVFSHIDDERNIYDVGNFFLQIRHFHNDRSSHLSCWKQGMFGIFAG